MNEIEQKIVDKCEELGVSLLALFKSSKAGEMVDNGVGMEFPLPKYCIVTEEDLILAEDGIKFIGLIEFEDRNDIEILKLVDSGYQPTVYGQLYGDGYKIVWQNDKFEYKEQ